MARSECGQGDGAVRFLNKKQTGPAFSGEPCENLKSIKWLSYLVFQPVNFLVTGTASNPIPSSTRVAGSGTEVDP